MDLEFDADAARCDELDVEGFDRPWLTGGGRSPVRSRVMAGVLSMALVAGLSSCGSSGGRARGDCDDADPAVVKDVMSHARTSFLLSGSTGPDNSDEPTGTVVDHLKLRASGTGPLPEKTRQFGADRLLTVLVSAMFGGQDGSDDFAGIEVPAYFALDAKGDVIGPVVDLSEQMFDLESPDDPDWPAWSAEVADSDPAYDLFGCLQPD